MSLPSGYKRLEYIKANGSQLINSGFVVNTSDIRLFGEFEPTALGSTPNPMFGCYDSGSSGPFFSVEFRDGYFFCARGTGLGSSLKQATVNTKYSVDFSLSGGKFSLKVDGTEIMNTTFSGIINTKNPYGIMGVYYNSGTSLYPANMKCYGLKQYSGQTLVRDYIPCQTTAGEIGLWDDVNSVFYGNAGTGTFTAGPEVVYEPDAPTNFAASVSGQTVALSWASSANADGYRLKRNGVQIAEQTGTTYTDTVPDEIALCTYTLTAYNDDGESAAAALTVILRLDLITDRTRADVANQTDKGFYNASDLNRVGAAVEYIAGRFTALGYSCPVTVKKDWLTSDAPTASQMEAYRQNIVTLRGQIAVMASTPDAPASMAGLNYVKANNIEQILLDLDALIDKLIKSWCFSGELYAGEV